MDVLLDDQVTGRSSNEYAAEVVDRLEEAYKLTCEQLGAAAMYSKGWYDRRAKQQLFEAGEAVRVLDQRGYAKRAPKWQLSYSQTGKIVRRLNDVTYIATAPGWKGSRILHVDKLRRMVAGSIGPSHVPVTSQQAADSDRSMIAAPQAVDVETSSEEPSRVQQAVEAGSIGPSSSQQADDNNRGTSYFHLRTCVYLSL